MAISKLKTTAAGDWKPGNWRAKNAVQQANYPDQKALDEALKVLALYPPLVTSWEVNSLCKQLGEAALGKRFLLQGGDCAEQFVDCEAPIISNRLKVLLQMSLVLVHGLKKPVVRLGRFAGQYAKPRSSDMETIDGVSLPSYRGDLINSPPFTTESRTPDPGRLLRGYATSAMTLNFVRGLIDGGFADLHHPEYWDLSWVEHSSSSHEYSQMVESIGESLRFMETLAGRKVGSLTRVDFYISHEALHLPYEQAQTRTVPRQPGWYNLGTHFPWIGMRTAALDGAHLEYCRGIRNPIGVKIGPGADPDHVSRLVDILNPENEAGRLTLIHRMGFDQVEKCLQPLISAVQRTGKTVLWTCDPMHGNTVSTKSGVKTRRFEHIHLELDRSFDVHRSMGSILGGVHLELTGENVTECVGGARQLTEQDLKRAYKTTVDPRLNYEQSLELAMLIVKKGRK